MSDLILGEPPLVAEGEFQLVAVVAHAGRGHDGRYRRKHQPTKPFQVVDHLLLLVLELLRVGEVLPLAAATGAEVLAEGGDAIGGGGDDPRGDRLGVVALLLGHAHIHHIARYSAGNEDHHAFVLGNGLALRTRAFNGEVLEEEGFACTWFRRMVRCSCCWSTGEPCGLNNKAAKIPYFCGPEGHTEPRPSSPCKLPASARRPSRPSNSKSIYGAHNYHPLPVVLDSGKGVFVWDVEGKRYYDFLSAYSAVNQGHCHPRLGEGDAGTGQRMTLTSRAFYNSVLGELRPVPCADLRLREDAAHEHRRRGRGDRDQDGAQVGLREEGHRLPDQAKIIVCEGNFHGRTITIISMSTDPDSQSGFGPFTPGFEVIPYDDIPALEKALEDPNVCAFLVEPIQGEKGVYVPVDDYIPRAIAACKARNVLFIADEIQTGIARTGRLLCQLHNNG